MQDVVTRLSLPRIGLPTTRPASLPGRVFLWQWGIRPAAQHLPRQRKGVYAGHKQSLLPCPGVNAAPGVVSLTPQADWSRTSVPQTVSLLKKFCSHAT